MDNGEVTYIMDGELFIRKYRTGKSMKESLRMEWKRVEDEYISEMEVFTMENFEGIKYQEEGEKWTLTVK